MAQIFLKRYAFICYLIIFLNNILQISCISNIITRKTIVEYDVKSKVNLEISIIANNYIRLQFPLSLHKILQSSVSASIIKNQDALNPTNPIQLNKIQSLTNSGINEYTFLIKDNLDKNIFYSLYIFPEEIKNYGWFSQGARILVISDNDSPIVYAKNVNAGSFSVKSPLIPQVNDMKYFNINKLGKSNSNIINNIDSAVSTQIGITEDNVKLFQQMGMKYWLSIYTKIDQNVYGSSIIRFSIDAPGSTEFVLLNYCKVVKLSTNIMTEPIKSTCKVDQIENYLEAIIEGDLNKNDEFQIFVGIQNAYFSVQNDVSLFIGNQQTRQLYQHRRIQNALITEAIIITIQRLNLFFGIAYNEQEKNFPLGVFQSVSSLATPVYNSISLSFNLEQNFNLPNDRKLRIKLNVTPATEILSSSIKTNLEPVPSMEVYCKYFQSLIICDNVGKLVKSKRYSISFKAFFNELVKPTQFTDFCQLTIEEYRPKDPRSSFLSTPGIQVKLFTNHDLRDTQPGGWHTQAFEYTPVVSAPEKPTLKEVYDSVYSTTGSVGITPDQTEQSILFLLRATEKEFCNSNLSLCSNTYISQLYFRTTILFNHNVIKFTPGREANGVDFAAMNSAAQLDQASFSTLTDEVSSGLVFFDCGVLQKDLDPGIFPSAVSNCLNLKGKGTSQGSNGLLALRNVRFDQKFKHTSFYADDTVLDFVVTFMRGIMVNQLIPKEYEYISTNLINAYTIQRQALTTVKAGYINYYVDSTNKYNDGYDIPVLFRLGGTFPSSASFGVVKVAIFLDESIDFTNFYSSKSSLEYVEKPYSYGCSEKECMAYKVTAGGNLDAHNLHNMVVVTLNPTTDVSQPFNIIIPMSNNDRKLQPTRVVVGLIDDLNQVKAVFRIYGPPSLGDTTVLAMTPPLQGLAQQTNPYAFPFQPSGQKFSYLADGTNIKSSTTGSILLKAGTDTSFVVKGNGKNLWGAGLTVVSRNQDIFTSSKTSISFKNHPGSFKQCSLAKYNLVNHPLGLGNNGVYFALYCPVDEEALPADFFKTDKGDLININTPFSYFWGSNLKLSNILSYALSDNNGLLLGSYQETVSNTAPVSNMQKCIIDQTMTITQPNSRGKQVLIIPISFNQDYSFDPLFLKNTPIFMVEITFSDAVTGFALDGTYCVIKGYLEFKDYFDCTPTWTDNKVARIKLKAKKEFILEKGKTFQVELQVNENLSVNFDKTSIVYTVNVLLPDAKANPKDNFPSVFSNPDTTKVITESCSGGSLQLGNKPLETQMEIKDLKTKFINQRGRGYLKLDFNIISTRYRVNKNGYFLLELGFLKDQNLNDNQRMDILDCKINQKLKSSTTAEFETSFLFSKILYTGSSSIQITLKNDLNDPQLYQFQLFCINMRTPSDAFSGDSIKMNFKDQENIDYFASVANIGFTDITFVPIKQNQFLELLSWNGYSEGQFTNYKFKIPNVLDEPDKQEITQFSRLYAGFSSAFNSNLSDSISCKQNDQLVYCVVDPTHPRMLQIQLNQGPIQKDDFFTIEINNLKSSYIDPSINGVYFCLIRDFRTQIGQTDFILCDFQQIVPLKLKSTVVPTDIKPIEVRKNKNLFYLGKDQVFTIDMKISAGVFDYRNFLLVEIPSIFSRYILDGDPVSCEISTPSRQDNLSYGCTYYNQRYIKIALVKDPQNYFNDTVYSLSLYKMYLPEALSGPLADQIQFNFLVYDFNIQNIIAYSSSYGEKPLNFIPDNTVARLKWQNSDSYTIYKGYYKSKFTLLPQDNTVFLSQFTLKQATENKNLIFTSDPLLATLGNAQTDFQIAGLENSLIGIFNIDFVKSNNEINYQKVPRLTVSLSNNPCVLKNVYDEILIAQDGVMVVPISLNDCIPLNDFQLKATIIDPSTSGIFKFSDSQQIQIVDVLKGSINAYFTVVCEKTAAPDLTLELKIEVLNNLDYQPNPKNIVLKVQNQSQQQSNPLPDPINFSSQTDNFIKISVGCDQPGYIVWVSGASNLNYEQYESIYMYENMVLKKNTKDCGGSTKDFCYNFFLLSKPVMSFQVLVPNLISRQLYFFKYFCRNQIGIFSNERSFTFRAGDNQGRMNKIVLQLNKVVSDTSQIQNVLCFVSQLLVSNYLRVIDPNNLSCQDTTLYKTTIKRVPDQIFYIYVLPNLTVSSDKTNERIKQIFKTPTVFAPAMQGINAQLIDFKTEFYDDQNIPDFIVSQFTTEKTLLKMKVDFKSFSGFFIIGFITISESLPQKEQFLKSVNYLNVPISKVQKHFIPKGLSRDIEFSFDNLIQEGRIYNSLFIAVPDNPQFNIDFVSDLQNKTFSVVKTEVDKDDKDNDKNNITYSIQIQSFGNIIIMIIILSIM